MGQEILAGCALCGYSPGSVSVGGTRGGFRTYNPFPAICNDCHSVTSVNRRETPLACTECNGTNVIEYGDATRESGKPTVDETPPVEEVLDNVLRPPSGNKYVTKTPWCDGRHLCPKCNQYGFEFGETIAFYD